MKSRLMIVLLSLIFAAAATAAAAYYIAEVKASVTEGQEAVGIVVVKKPVPAGASVAEMLATGSVSVMNIPKQYVSDGALTSLSGYSDRVVSANLVKGDQLTESKFKKVNEAGLAYKVPDTMVAVSVPIDEVTGVGGSIQPGDKVDVIATFSPGPGDTDITRIMLQSIEILATSDAGAGSEGDGLVKRQSGTSKKTVTLAVFPAQAEKIVFAAEKGHIWLGLRHTGNDKWMKTSGQTVGSVFK